MNVINKIKQKREFSELPDSVVKRVMEITKDDVKESRALLRKYFGVFLTNKILKGKCLTEKMLKMHLSSKKRNYEKFYREVFCGMKDVGSVIDLGCGVNGFSYCFLRDVVGDINYLGVEASGQLVKHMNNYFKTEDFSAKSIVGDLFDIKSILEILKKKKKKRIVFLFQVVDALENLERDFSKTFIMKISEECEKIVLSLPMESLGGRKKFTAQRKWIIDFLEENFIIEKDFIANGERTICFYKK